MKGFKIFENDWTCKGFQFEIGKEYTFDGEIELCKKGFHFCTILSDCFKYYPPVQWNKFAEVEIPETATVLNSEDSKKCTNKIKIVRELSFEEVIEIINKTDSYSRGTSGSRGTSDSSGTSGSRGTSDSRGTSYSSGTSYSRGTSGSSGTSYSRGTSGSSGTSDSSGTSYSRGTSDSWGATKCLGVSKTIFCYEFSGKLACFNKKITENRFAEIFNRLNSFNWYPEFHNMTDLYLKNGGEWEKTPIPKTEKVTKEKAWEKMPEEMKKYVASLKEFNPKMFLEITGIKLKKLWKVK